MESDILMPRLGVNDDYVTLVLWLVKSGDLVEAGQKIAEIETSKESSELSADRNGIITLLAKEGSDVSVGSTVASIGGDMKLITERKTEEPQLRMTEKARKIVEKNGIDCSLLPKERLIKERDVMALVSKEFSLEGTKNNEIILYGGGGFTEIAIDILKVTHAYHVYGIVDMKYPDLKEVMGIPVIGADEALQELYNSGYRKIFNGVGARGAQYWRKPPYEKLREYGFEFPNIVHAKAILEPSVSVGEGTIVCAGAIIGAQAQIGNNCVINAGSIISHDCIISDNCHIASGAVLAGIVTIGENTLVGQNVTVYSRVRIGSNVVIENGCSIFKDVPDHSVVRYKER